MPTRSMAYRPWAVQGRYITSGSQAGSNERALAVTDALVQSVRKPA